MNALVLLDVRYREGPYSALTTHYVSADAKNQASPDTAVGIESIFPGARSAIYSFCWSFQVAGSLKVDSSFVECLVGIINIRKGHLQTFFVPPAAWGRNDVQWRWNTSVVME
jgi:hypothetical protein